MLQLITGPTASPLDLAEVKQHLRVPYANDDALLASWLDSAAEYAENITRKQLVAARWKQVLDGFPGYAVTGGIYGQAFSRPGNAIYLERGPVINVVSIDYLDMSGTPRTVGVDDSVRVVVDYSADPVRITPVFGQIWPIPVPQIAAVSVTFDAGYMAPFTAVLSGSPPAPSGAIAVSGWPALAVGAAVRFCNSGGALPAPLKVKTDYFIQSVVSPGVYTLSTTPSGGAMTLTSAGTGTNYLGQLPACVYAWMRARIGALNENREEITQGSIITPIPMIDRLLDGATTWQF